MFKLLGTLFLAAAFVNGFDESKCFDNYIIQTNPPNLPGNVFVKDELTTSSIYSATTQECKIQYPDCFEKNGIPPVDDYEVVSDTSYCREIFRYTVPLMDGVTSSPSVPNGKPPLRELEARELDEPACTCCLPPQASVGSNITFEFTMTTDDCCMKCDCYGDPHCNSFDGQFDNWIVCNGRDPNSCEVIQDNCIAKQWGGKPCIFKSDSQGNGACMPDKTVAVPPKMMMYSKSTAVNGVHAFVSIELTLGNLGNIVCIDAKWGQGSDNQRALYCVPSYGGTGLPNNVYNNLPVGTDRLGAISRAAKVDVSIVLKNPNSLSERLELVLQDFDTNPSQERTGFCHVGRIVEKLSQDDFSCVPSESFIYKRMCWAGRLQTNAQCSKRSYQAATLQAGKDYWCQKSFPTDAVAAAACKKEVWYKSICKVLCLSDSDVCYDRCISRIQETPNEVITQLPWTGGAINPSTPTKNPTPAPTPCPSFGVHPFPNAGGNTLPDGKPVTDAYVYLEKRVSVDSGGVETWGSPLLWWTEDQVKCSPVISVKDSQGEFPVMDRGQTYRLLQCQQRTVSTTCGDRKIDVTAKVTYSNGQAPLGNSQNTIPLNELLLDSDFCCNPNKHPGCPACYQCCMYLNELDWNRCMKSKHPTASTATCKRNTAEPTSAPV